MLRKILDQKPVHYIRYTILADSLIRGGEFRSCLHFYGIIALDDRLHFNDKSIKGCDIHHSLYLFASELSHSWCKATLLYTAEIRVIARDPASITKPNMRLPLRYPAEALKTK